MSSSLQLEELYHTALVHAVEEGYLSASDAERLIWVFLNAMAELGRFRKQSRQVTDTQRQELGKAMQERQRLIVTGRQRVPAAKSAEASDPAPAAKETPDQASQSAPRATPSRRPRRSAEPAADSPREAPSDERAEKLPSVSSLLMRRNKEPRPGAGAR